MNCPKCGQDWPDLPEASRQDGCPACLLEFVFAARDGTPESAVQTGRPTRLGPYTIGDVVGQGGMGVVYRARHEGLDRTVALKLLHPACAAQKGFPERFQREGQVLAALNHPNIVGVFDLGCEGGTYFLAMEYVVGPTLRALLQAGPLGWDRAVTIFVQLCDALQYAHERGVIHRDIKPANVLIEPTGRVKIGDFGVAKLIGASAEALPPLTEAGAVVGTRCYMAPEQLQPGKDVDHRTDLYALGIVLYEMLTGELPLGVFPPPSKKGAADARLDAVILRALDQERERRPESARAFKEMVVRAANANANSRAGHRIRRATWISALLFTVILAVAVTIHRGASEKPTVSRDSAASVRPSAPSPVWPRVLTGHQGRVWAVAFAPDGQSLASAGEDRMLRFWDPTTGAAQSSFEAYPRGELGYLALAFGPQGRTLATAGGEGVVRLWDVAARKEIWTGTGHGREVTAVAFAPDGTLVASASHDRTIRLWDTPAGKTRRILSGHTDPVLCVAFSPDGKKLASGAMNGNVRVWDPLTGDELATIGHARRVWAVAFAQDGSVLASGSHERNIKLWHLGSSPPGVRVLQDGPEVWALAFSPDSRWLASGSHDGVVRLWDAAGAKLVRSLAGHTAPVVTLGFSPDGHYLATASWDQTIRLWDLRQLPP